MATYQARGRGRLLDSKTQAVLERRGKELLGLLFLVLGAIAVMILGSYMPEDPSWLPSGRAVPADIISSNRRAASFRLGPSRPKPINYRKL